MLVTCTWKNLSVHHLNGHSQEYSEERIDKVVDEEYLHRFGVWCAGKAGGHRQVDGGEGQQARDVHVDHHLVPVLGRQVERGWGGDT